MIFSKEDLDVRKRRLQWRSRRGLLELDCLLQPFIHARLTQLTHDETHALETLLHLEDPALLDILMANDPDHPQATLIHEIMGCR